MLEALKGEVEAGIKVMKGNLDDKDAKSFAENFLSLLEV